MGRLLRFLFSNRKTTESQVREVQRRRSELDALNDDALKAVPRSTLLETIAVTAVVATRVLGIILFDVQIQGALALANGKVAEMKTGEGKTVAAVPAIVWYAQQGR